MRTIAIDEAGKRLDELADSAAAGDEVILMRDDKPVAKIVSTAAAQDAALASRPSLRDIQPTSVGAVLRPLTQDDDILGEMLEQ
jgi:antitoxin (DNA-binding transcriptional repressor) of toxin-antitoxin stability system